MIGLAEPGAEVWLSPNRNPKAKLDWRWELVRVGDHLVGINTGHPNGIVAAAIAAGRIPELAGYATLRREVKYGRNSSSEERRVGRECVSQCRTRGSPAH